MDEELGLIEFLCDLGLARDEPGIQHLICGKSQPWTPSSQIGDSASNLQKAQIIDLISLNRKCSICTRVYRMP